MKTGLGKETAYSLAKVGLSSKSCSAFSVVKSSFHFREEGNRVVGVAANLWNFHTRVRSGHPTM